MKRISILIFLLLSLVLSASAKGVSLKVLCDGKALLTATPVDGYQFAHWQDGNTDNPRTIFVSDDATYTAYFELKANAQVILLDNEAPQYYEETLSTYDGEVVDVTIQGRTFRSGMYNDVCLPFDLSYEQMNAAFGADNVFLFSDYVLTSSTLDFVFDIVGSEGMHAGWPYLVLPKKTGAITFRDVMIETFDQHNPYGTRQLYMYGVLQPKDFVANDKSVIVLAPNNVMTYPSTKGGTHMKAFHAYFQKVKSAPQGVLQELAGGDRPTRIVIRRPSATDILTMPEDETETVRKYVEDGLLIIEKDGIRYTATGTVID